MRNRRSLQIAAGLAVLVAPLASFAQIVTTGPLSRSAPALSMPSMFLLAAVLVIVAGYSIRKTGSKAVRAAIMVVALTGFAGLGYAGAKGVVITDPNCNVIHTFEYSEGGDNLMNNCPNAMQILDINPCGQPLESFPGGCSEGQILGNGDGCELQGCEG